METTEGAELCFPLLLNSSCRKPQSDGTLVNVLLYFISLLIVTLNLLVIISISHFRQLHSPTNLLILSLAVSDLLVGLLLMPVQILLSEACWYLGDFMCALYFVVNFVITSSSVGNMVLISIYRYLAICDPLNYNTRVNLDKTKICVCLCWISSFFYNILLLLNFMKHPDVNYSCYGECVVVLNHNTGSIDLVFTFIGPITLIIVLYLRIFMVALSQARAMRSHIESFTLRPKVGITARKSEMKATRTLSVVVVVFLICFCPYYSPSLTGEVIENSNLFLPFVVWLLYFNSCLNPVIYAFFYPWFRKSVKLIVTLKIMQVGSCDANIL
ncbi:trace amine-associated receptor 13c-like [Pungitius pungitius]|uniref:trace amine-associated receptor 13c-like n=1 Tax=Pungitius pungitius TaxID=134920 RepID=UPI002E0DA4E5